MVNLHQHSNFSDGYGFPEQIAEYSKELNYTGIALTDHGTVSGFYYLQKVAIEFGLKPIYGVEVYLIPTPEARKMKNSTFHTILLAKNLEGLKELYRIISISNDEEHFYRKPKIDLKSLYNNLLRFFHFQKKFFYLKLLKFQLSLSVFYSILFLVFSQQFLIYSLYLFYFGLINFQIYQ